MSDQVEQIKNKVDIVELIGERVALKKAGRHFRGLCPFHSEKTPSFTVSPEMQIFKCFGCGEGGDAIAFLQKFEGMSFLEALEFLAKRVGVVLDEFRPSNQDLQKKRHLEILELASRYYHYLLVEHKIGEEAREYLVKRSITNETREVFGLGYAPETWRGVSDFLIKKKGFRLEELQAVGLVIVGERGYYDRFRGRLMFPLRDHKGSVVGFSGRILRAEANEAKYINSPETTLYSKAKMLYGLFENKKYIKKADRVLVVEGEFDMMASWQAGIKEVVAIKGSAFTDEQARLIGRYTKNVLFALDADSAGQEAIKRSVKVADPLDLSIRVVQIEGGKDPGDVAMENPAKWREMVRGSVLFYDFLIDSFAKKIDAKTGEGAKLIAKELLPVIAEIGNLVVQARYVGELAKMMGIAEAILYEEIERIKKKKQLKILSLQVRDIEQSPQKGREKIEVYFLSLILQNPFLLGAELEGKTEELFAMRAVRKIVERRIEFGEKFRLESFVEGLPAELKPVLEEAFLTDLSHLKNKEEVEKEYSATLKKLSEIALREGMKNLTVLMTKAEKEGDQDKLRELQERFVRLTRQMQVAQEVK